MEIRRRWTVGWGRLIRSPKIVTAILAACLLLGFGLTVLANVPEAMLRDTRHFEGPVAPFAEGQNALRVPNATFDGFGFAEARAEDLACGVGVVFLETAELRAFLDTGVLPIPQLHCDQSTARLPGSIAAVLVENGRQNASNWAFDLALFGVARPYALYGLPAFAFLLVGGIGLPIVLFQRLIPRWIERQLLQKKQNKE